MPMGCIAVGFKRSRTVCLKDIGQPPSVCLPWQAELAVVNNLISGIRGNSTSNLQNKKEGKRGVNQKDEIVDLVLHKLSLSEDNAEAGQVVDSEKVETESGALSIKEVCWTQLWLRFNFTVQHNVLDVRGHRRTSFCKHV